MSYENVKAYFEGRNLGERVIVREHIAKTMSFIQNGEPVLICMAGDAKISNPKYKQTFHQKAVMIPGGQVEELVGHIPGAVCPFAIKEGVKVYLDVSLKRFETVYTAGGSLNSTVTLSLSEMEEHSNPSGWVDVCKDWFVN